MDRQIANKVQVGCVNIDGWRNFFSLEETERDEIELDGSKRMEWGWREPKKRPKKWYVRIEVEFVAEPNLDSNDRSQTENRGVIVFHKIQIQIQASKTRTGDLTPLYIPSSTHPYPHSPLHWALSHLVPAQRSAAHSAHVGWSHSMALHEKGTREGHRICSIGINRIHGGRTLMRGRLTVASWRKGVRRVLTFPKQKNERKKKTTAKDIQFRITSAFNCTVHALTY